MHVTVCTFELSKLRNTDTQSSKQQQYVIVSNQISTHYLSAPYN